MNQNNEVIIRVARAEDCEHILEKIVDLAKFEKMEDQVQMTTEQLIKDGGFKSPNDPKHYECFIAETKIDGKMKLIGYAIWFYSFNSWQGKIGYLEDIYVDANFRRKGIAKRFFNLIAKEVLKNNGAWLKLNVLDWNVNAKKCYDSHGGIDMTNELGYHVYKFNYDQLIKLAKQAEDLKN